MSRTQHARLASREVDENGKGKGQGGQEGDRKKLGDTYQDGKKQ